MKHLNHEILFRGEASISNRNLFPVCVLGAGALGSWLTDLLTRQGYHSITCVDFDKVESDNFGTQFYGTSDVGRLKVNQLALNIFKRLGIKINPVVRKIDAQNISANLKNHKLIIDVFDNAESREIVRQYCSDSKIPCVHAGLASVGFFEIVWNDCYKTPKLEQNKDVAPCDYPMSSNLVMTCVSVLAEIVNLFVDKGEMKSVEFWQNELKLSLLNSWRQA